MESGGNPYRTSIFYESLASSEAGPSRLDVRRKREAYYGEIPRPAMQALLEKLDTAQTAGEFERLFAENTERHLYDYAFDDSRSDWIELFLHAERPIALDYGAGLGNFALRLAPRCAEVWGVDGTPERLDLIDRRARLAGHANLFTLLADHPEDLPFPEASFDLVLLNGVLEWTAVGLSSLSRSPEDVHREFLAALLRLLKPGGSLVIAIENRWSLFHFLGATEHNDFKFAPLLPRAVASWINMRLAGPGKGGPYETWTYSAPALRHLLRAAGAEPGRLFWAFPSYQQARLILDERTPYFEMLHALHNLLPARTWRWRALRAVLAAAAALGAMPALAPAFIIEAVRPEP